MVIDETLKQGGVSDVVLSSLLVEGPTRGSAGARGSVKARSSARDLARARGLARGSDLEVNYGKLFCES